MKQIIKKILRKFITPLLVILGNELKKLHLQQTYDNRKKILLKIQSCGSGVRINGDVYISQPKAVSIGNNVHIGGNAYFKTEGGLTIGDNTHISRNFTLYTVNHNYEGTALPFDQDVNLKPCSIGKN